MHHDAVGVAGGLQAVGDQDGGAAPGDQPHRLLHPGLGGEVEVGGRLVEQEDRRVDELGPGEGDQLALPGRQRAAPLGDRRGGSRRAGAAIKSWAPTARAAASTSASVASGRP